MSKIAVLEQRKSVNTDYRESNSSKGGVLACENEDELVAMPAPNFWKVELI